MDTKILLENGTNELEILEFIVDGNCIQLIGIGNEQGEFDFYRQIYPVTGGEHKVEALMWTHLPA